jgi:molybdopterin-guanine dinucleotide biosynthesis protein A
MRSSQPARDRPSAKRSGLKRVAPRPLVRAPAQTASLCPPDTNRPTVAILAGGFSTRMGRDKSALPWGRSTLLEHIRRMALQTAWPVRVIRRDLVPPCGPLGGIYTAFRRHRSPSILFLACDMPLVTPSLLAKVWRAYQSSRQPVFTVRRGRFGFPFVLRRDDLPTVQEHVRNRDWSLQALAVAVQAMSLTLPRGQSGQLVNLNTLEGWAKARRRWTKF